MFSLSVVNNSYNHSVVVNGLCGDRACASDIEWPEFTSHQHEVMHISSSINERPQDLPAVVDGDELRAIGASAWRIG